MSENLAAEYTQPVGTEVANGDLIPEDSEFTLKPSMKRKALESDSSELDSESELDTEVPQSTGPEYKTTSRNSEEEIAVPDEDDSEGESKVRIARKKALKLARKAEKKEQKDRKRAEKQAKKNNNSASAIKEEADESDEPFDYSEAKSVLKAEKTTANNTSATRKARFNPYALTAEGPKPARKMHGERAGKSATFKR